MNLSVRRQRWLVLGAILVVATASVLLPRTGDRALGQGRSSAYQPFACDQPGSADPQQRRQEVQLDNGAGDFNAAGRMHPCLAGVRWHLQSGSVTTSDPGLAIGQIRTAYGRKFPNTVYYAAAGSRTDLYQVAFSGLQFCTGDTTPVAACPASGTNDIQLYADSGDAPAPKAAGNYRLTIDPDQAITIGGSGVWTEVLATANSSFTVPVAQLPTATHLACGLVGGTARGGFLGIGGTCELSASDFAGDLAQWLGGGENYTLLGVNLDFYYLVTHRQNPSDPYTQVPVDGSGNPLNSIQLPNTTISVS
ncbi:hypothetical protein CFH99_21315 [Nocardioides aromaticivorans]|uniref:Secreted protein n=1 Tax=Nocardioides aromaticivorans TaxID=200618 RepID=A0ABX7PRC6_9ACTN|nr:hypothetical protein [Nocardioides aromaticivorans]QSR28165.1 hypothetical protein CFH99_21315 [Nocardioides aromaticivorans]